MMLAAHQKGLTLLEVLIALSIFSIIGVASYQVLNTTIESQRSGEAYSKQLALQQRAMMIIDRDMQQIIARDVRTSATENASFLVVNGEVFPLEFTRGGQRNPLSLPRSSMQRIAYDVGLHPEAANRTSKHYQDETRYLRRHIWSALDRNEDTTRIVQTLLPGVDQVDVAVITEQGRYIQWPVAQSADSSTNEKPIKPIAIELSLKNDDDVQFTRIYQVL